jgi:hypothetical protein
LSHGIADHAGPLVEGLEEAVGDRSRHRDLVTVLIFVGFNVAALSLFSSTAVALDPPCACEVNHEAVANAR